MSDQINIAIVGLGFGAEFIPIYQRHPHANLYAICQRTADKLNAIGEAFGVAKRYTDFEELLEDPAIDAVHINTPIPDHALTIHQGVKSRQACCLHRTHGDDGRGVSGNYTPQPGNR